MAEERAQRRLAAILAADVVGYSRLMGADEEGTLAALRTVRRELADPKIDEYRGRIIKTTGDGLLAVFASVVDAVRCAVSSGSWVAVVARLMYGRSHLSQRFRLRFRHSGIGYGSVPGSASGIVVIPTASVLCLSAKAIATRSSAWISSNSASTSLIFLAYLASIAARRPFNSSFARSR